MGFVNDGPWANYITEAPDTLENGSVGTNQLVDLSVTTQKLANGSVTTGKISSEFRLSNIRTFDTVAAMQAATDLEAGMTCHTNGFHAAGDGGAAFYVVGTSETANGMDVLACANSLKATLLVTEPYVTPEQFGAYGDGVTDDASSIQTAIDYMIEHETSFMAMQKEYAVENTINILTPNEAQKDYFIDFCGAKIKATAEMNEVFLVETSSSGFGYDIAKNNRLLQNVTIDCNELAEYGIYHKMGRNLWYTNVGITNAKICAFYADGQAQINMMFIDRRMYNYTNTIGIQLNATDNKVNNVRIRDSKTGIIVNGSSSFLTGVHCWLINPSVIPGSRCFVVNAGNQCMTNCHADTYETAWVLNVNSPIFLSQCKAYTNPDFYNDDVTTVAPIVFDSDSGTSVLKNILNSNLKCFGFEIDSAPYLSATGRKPVLANGLGVNDFYGPNWNVWDTANKLLNNSEVEGVPSVTTRGNTALRNMYTLSNALPLLREPSTPTIDVPSVNTIAIVENGVIDNGFAATGFLRLNITTQAQAILVTGLPKPLKAYHVLGCSTGSTQNVPNKIVHFIVNINGQLSVFGYSSSYPLSGEYIIPIEYSTISK